ncbi:hypothetical protein ACIODW_07275 [Streptomyces sp. NPDC087897]|uniref:hypothetical protein n=1 Tax=Streptomyces sp. NPDC087897 TaxID=3365817 RepID=UPI00381BE036
MMPHTRAAAQAAGRDERGCRTAALGFFFVVLPCLAIVSFTCFAACRSQRHRIFKALAYVFLSAGLVCGLTPVGVVIWATTL